MALGIMIKFAAYSDMLNIADIRTDYRFKSFSEQDVMPDPFSQFEAWFNESLEAKVNEPNAMTLATVKHDGSPSARVVLLKHFDEKGFVFFTNHNSNKGHELTHHSEAALVFFWPELFRQVRVEGRVSRVDKEASDNYFNGRPYASRISAHVSPQSQVIPGRDFLEKRFNELEKKYENTEIPRPENWGGYCVSPERIEFWQGRENRLHDRFLFCRKENGTWQRDRLAP